MSAEPSSDATTVRLSRHTRDQVNALANERGVTADRAIAEAIASLRENELRRQAERESLEWSRDPADRAELAAAIRDLRGDDE